MVFGKLRSLFGGAVSSALPPSAGRESADESYTIEAAWRDYFAPVLRQHGFKGAGRHFRRVSGGVFQAVNLQGSRSGGKFAVNLGINPLTVPDVSGNPIDAKKSRELDCELRRRLSEDLGDTWWAYTDARESMIEAASAAARMFETHGWPLFEKQADPEGPLFTMSPARFELEGARPLSGFASTGPRMALVLARLRKSQGNMVDCRGFAFLGLENWSSNRELKALSTEGE